jgi:hypothetical protein
MWAGELLENCLFLSSCPVARANVPSPVLDIAERNLTHQPKEETGFAISDEIAFMHFVSMLRNN